MKKTWVFAIFILLFGSLFLTGCDYRDAFDFIEWLVNIIN